MLSRLPGIFNLFYNQPVAPSEAEKKREAIHDLLHKSQYALLIYSAYLLAVEGRTFSAIGTAMVSTYLEKIAMNFYDKVMHDPRTAYYIGSKLSTISQYSTVFNPVVNPVHNKIIDLLTVEPIDIDRFKVR